MKPTSEERQVAATTFLGRLPNLADALSKVDEKSWGYKIPASGHGHR